jgi:hypothetical protein
MRTPIRLVLGGLAAGLLLCSLVAAASAGNLSISNQNIRATWTGLRFESKTGQVPMMSQFSCPVTMEGSLHARTFRKMRDTLIGAITRAIANHPCEAGAKEFVIHNGTETVLRGGAPATSLPWPIFYSSFTGTLPAITSLIVEIQGMIITVIYPALGGCLRIYGSAAESRLWVFTVEVGGAITGLEPRATEPGLHLIRTAATLECAQLAKLSGQSNTFTLLGTTTRVTVRLI